MNHNFSSGNITESTSYSSSNTIRED